MKKLLGQIVSSIYELALPRLSWRTIEKFQNRKGGAWGTTHDLALAEWPDVKASIETFWSASPATIGDSTKLHLAVRLLMIPCIRTNTSQTVEVTVMIVPPVNETREGIIETIEGRGPRMVAGVGNTTLIPIGTKFGCKTTFTLDVIRLHWYPEPMTGSNSSLIRFELNVTTPSLKVPVAWKRHLFWWPNKR